MSQWFCQIKKRGLKGISMVRSRIDLYYCIIFLVSNLHMRGLNNLYLLFEIKSEFTNGLNNFHKIGFKFAALIENDWN
jgi:hypothetical protein